MRAAFASAIALVTGCGGPSAPVASPKAVVPVSPPAVVEAPLTQVAPPPELFAVARFANPARAMDTAVRWASLPLDWRGLIAREVPGLERVLAFDAPVDVIAVLDPAAKLEPRVNWAFSAGVSSPDAAANFFREQGRTVTRDTVGSYRMHDSDLDCVAIRALGTAPARVVCSDDANAVDALAPYMARGLPTESFGPAEIHAHVVAEPFQRRYGAQIALLRTVGVPFALRELELDSPAFDRALRDALYGLSDEVIALAVDANRIDLDATVTPDGTGLDVSTSFAFSGQKSWTASTFALAAPHAAAAPDFFWKLPEDATAASFSVYSDPTRMAGVAESVRALLDGWLAFEKMSEPRRAALTDAVGQAFTISAKSAYATFPVAPNKTPVVTDADRTRDAARVQIGSHLFALDNGGDHLTNVAAELVKALSDPGFRAHLVKTGVVSADELPKALARAPKSAKGLPKGSKVFELDLPGVWFSPDFHPPMLQTAAAPKHARPKAPKSTTRALPFLLAVVPDGSLTWFSIGTDETETLERIVLVRAGGAATLANREGLGTLRTDPVLSGGFSSLAAGLASFMSPGAPKSLELDENALNRLPHKGETPILIHVGVDAHGPKVTAAARLPQPVIEDVVALASSQLPKR